MEHILNRRRHDSGKHNSGGFDKQYIDCWYTGIHLGKISTGMMLKMLHIQASHRAHKLFLPAYKSTQSQSSRKNNLHLNLI